jgi:putative ABC transport system permease protein
LPLEFGERFMIEGEGRGKDLQQFDSLLTEKGKVTESLQNKKAASYTILGFIKRPAWEPAWAPGYTIITYLDENLVGANDTVNASVI